MTKHGGPLAALVGEGAIQIENLDDVVRHIGRKEWVLRQRIELKEFRDTIRQVHFW